MVFSVLMCSVLFRRLSMHAVQKYFMCVRKNVFLPLQLNSQVSVIRLKSVSPLKTLQGRVHCRQFYDSGASFPFFWHLEYKRSKGHHLRDEPFKCQSWTVHVILLVSLTCSTMFEVPWCLLPSSIILILTTILFLVHHGSTPHSLPWMWLFLS